MRNLPTQLALAEASPVYTKELFIKKIIFIHGQATRKWLPLKDIAESHPWFKALCLDRISSWIHGALESEAIAHPQPARIEAQLGQRGSFGPRP